MAEEPSLRRGVPELGGQGDEADAAIARATVSQDGCWKAREKVTHLNGLVLGLMGGPNGQICKGKAQGLARLRKGLVCGLAGPVLEVRSVADDARKACCFDLLKVLLEELGIHGQGVSERAGFEWHVSQGLDVGLTE